ncbi:MAG: hypothetical protein H7334_07735, partial [Ferruginibacter sp.]|nr:hypothetical protein [Ferruginibacter sp.]
MNSETILKSDVLDIIFEKRNKLYGAYALRKFYNNRLIKSVSICLGAATVLCAFTFLPEKKPDMIRYDEVTMAHILEPKKVEPKKEISKVVKAVAASVVKSTKPVIVADNTKADTILIIKPTDVIGSANIITKGTDGPLIIGAPTEGEGGGGAGNGVIAEKKPVDVTQPINNPDVQPTYPGGINALKRFLERNLVNPSEMEPGEMVAVNIRFVVGYDGKLQQFDIVKDGGELYNKEVIRVMKKMPQWVPGKANGENVAVYF